MANSFGILALFSLIGVLLGEDRRGSSDPRDRVSFWTIPGFRR